MGEVLYVQTVLTDKKMNRVNQLRKVTVRVPYKTIINIRDDLHCIVFFGKLF